MNGEYNKSSAKPKKLHLSLRAGGRPSSCKALCLLLAVVFIVGLFPVLGIQKAFAGTGDSWDLFNFVSGITVKDSDGETVGNGNFYYGDTYTFSINFAESQGNQLAYNSGTGKLHYALPPQIQVLFPVENGEIKLSNGKVVGWYNIELDGSVEVWFENVDNQGNTITQNFIDRYQNVEFSLDIAAKFAQGTGAGSIKFGADAQITINSIKEPTAGLRVSKNAAAFNKDNETVDFTVVVTAVGGPVDQIKLADVLKISGNNIPSSGYSVTQSNIQSAGVTFSYQLNNAGVWHSITPTWGGPEMQFDFTDVGTLAKDQNITLKYSMPLSAVLDYLGTQVSSGSTRYIQRLMYDLTLTNTATATGREKTANEPVSDKDDSKTPMKRTFLSKDGKGTTDGSTTEITWTATVGDGYGDKINGMAITDTLFASPAQTITGTIQVKFYNKSKTTQLGATLALTAENGNGITNFNATGGFTYTVPATPDDIFYAEFVYTTEADSAAVFTTYSNDISITLTSDTLIPNTSTASGRVGIGQDLKLTKNSEYVWDEKGTAPIALKYTITLTVPAGNQGKNIYLMDRYEGQYILWNAATAATRPNIDSAFRDNCSVSIYPDEPLFLMVPESGNSSNIQYESLYFRFDGSNGTSNQLWLYDEEKVITIVYEVPLDTPISANGSGQGTLLDFMRDKDGILYNQLMIYVGTPAKYISAYDAYTFDTYPIRKEVEEIDSGLYEYTLYLNSVQDHQATSALFANGSPAIVEDSFDPRLEYVEKSLYVRTSSSSHSSFAWGPYAGSPNTSQISSGTVTEVRNASTFTVDGTNGAIWMDLAQFRRLSMPGAWSAATLGSTGTTNWYYQNYTYEIHYQLKVKDSFKDDGFAAGNTATVYPATAKYIGAWTDSAEVQFGPEHVKKNIEQINGSMIDVEVIINEGGATLVPSGEDPSDRFTAVDTMSGDLAFYLSSIKIQTLSGSPATWVDAPAPQPDGLWSANIKDANTVEFVLPDETPVKITYKAQITVPAGGAATFRNEMSVFGYSDFFGEDRYIVQNSSGGAAALDFPIMLYKEDNDGNMLDGAEFELWESPPGNVLPYPSYVSTASNTAIVGGRAFYRILDANVTGNGAYEFYDSLHGLLYSGSGSVFMIVETASPVGYKLPANPNDRAYFVLNTVLDRQQLMTGFGQYIDLVADNILWKNEQETTSATIGGSKAVTGYDIPDTSFTFVLKELSDSTPGNYKTPGGVTRYAYVNDIDAAGTYGFTFEEIENLDVGTYYFEVFEADNGDPDWTYDLAKRLVTLTVQGDRTVSWDYTVGGGTFFNKYIGHSPTDYSFSIYKTDENFSPLAGAEFAVYTDELCNDIMGVNSSALSATTTGEVKFIGLSLGEYYYVKEIAAPAYYKSNSALYRFKLDSEGNGILEEKDGAGDWHTVMGNRVVNKPTTYTYNMKKTGDLAEHSSGLPGAKFDVYTDESLDLEYKLGTYESDGNGIVSIGGLWIDSVTGKGMFYIIESSVPSPYVVDDTVYVLTVTLNSAGDPQFVLTKAAGGAVVLPPIVNKSIRCDFSFVKAGEKTVIDGAPPGPSGIYPLQGVTFALFYNTACTDPVKKEDGVTNQAAASGADGKVGFSKVQPGTYYLKETAVPAWYEEGVVYKIEMSYSGNVTISLFSGNAPEPKPPVSSLDSWELVNMYKRYWFSFEKRFNTDSNILITATNTSLADNGDAEYSIFYDAGGFNAVTRSDGQNMKALSSSDGQVVFTGLPPGIYYVIETAISQAYTKTHSMSSDVIKVIIDKTGNSIITIDDMSFDYAVNKLKYGYCEVRKVDSVTHEGVMGVTFNGYRDDGSGTGPLDPAAIEITTNSDGWAYAFDEENIFGEGAGSPMLTAEYYWIQEASTPDAYSLDSTMYRLRRENNPYHDYDESDPEYSEWAYVYVLEEFDVATFTSLPNNTITNERLTGDVTLYKQDMADNGLAGAAFQLYSDMGCTNTVGLEVTSAGALGEVAFSDLRYGQTYYLKEITPPSGYVLNETVYSIIWLGGTDVLMSPLTGTATQDDMDHLVIRNYEALYDFPVFKKDQGSAGNGLAGAEFSLAGGTIDITLTTASSGVIWFRDVPAGSYVLEETNPPDGYVSAGPWDVKVNDDGSVEITLKSDGTPIGTYSQGSFDEKALALANVQLHYAFTFTKVDSDDKTESLQGATYGLYSDPICKNLIVTAVSDSSGEAEFYDLIPDTYYLKEIAPPQDYTISSDIYKVIVDNLGISTIYLLENDGHTTLGEITDKKITDKAVEAALYFRKVDREETHLKGLPEGLKDAEFELRLNGALIETFKSDESGWVYLTGLLPGKTYTLTESSVPDGYNDDSELYTVEVSGEGIAVLKRNGAVIAAIENSRTATSLTFSKRNSAGDGLSGAVFTLYDNSAATVTTKRATPTATSLNGTVTFHDVPWGTYYMKETSAPSGYEAINTIWTVVIGKDMSITINGSPAEGFTVANTRRQTITEPWTDVTVPEDDTPDEEDIDEENPDEEETLRDRRQRDEQLSEEPIEDDLNSQTPGGNDRTVQPIPYRQGNRLVQDGDGWIEVDDDDVPLGRWHWDDEQEEWVFELFDDDTPLANMEFSDMPQTGLFLYGSYIPYITMAFGFLLIGIGFLFRRKSHKPSPNPQS